MTMIKLAIAALSVVAVVSCATPRGAKPDNKSGLEPTQPEVITRTEYLPGKVVVQPYPVPDSALTPDVDPLTEEFIDGDDITDEDAVQTALAWSKQYHDLATTYDVLRGWIIGVRDGQNMSIDAPPVLDPPELDK